MDNLILDKRQVRRAFDRAARSYDAAAALQREVCDRMVERLALLKFVPHTILDAGCGTGYGLQGLRRHYPEAHVVALDLAPAMLATARGKEGWRRWLPWAGRGRQSYLCGDLEALPLRAGCIDMLWSNLAVQWCNDLPALFAGMHRVLAPDGLLMFSTFGPDTLKELRQAFGELDGYPHVSRFTDMHDIGDALVHAGFSAPVMDMDRITLTYDDLAQLMRDLKAIGAHNATAGRRKGMMGKGEWRRLQAIYETQRRNGKLPATYEVVYGHAWRGEKPTSADERVVHFMPRR
ncbi:MAG: malonyl-ACP O-methyltransferase BioC [Sulfuricella sp.]|nr:malonyl-ACP O-methyltransferase BioC [Sulfuricella sp.]